MKILILYPGDYAISSLELQARTLQKGFLELGQEAICLCSSLEFTKEMIYKTFLPNIVIGVGFWGDLPKMIIQPMEKGITAIPWFNADGWVANYHCELNALPLIFVTSNWVKSTYIRDGVKGENIYVQHIGFDPLVFYPRKKEESGIKNVRKMLGVEEDEKMILTIGGDVTSKGAQEMLKALAIVNKKFTKWKYICKTLENDSAKEYKKEEEKIIKENNLGNKIVYHTEIVPNEFIHLLLNACDIYAAPSRLEGFGMTQLEAQACGIPVVSINVGGPRDIIKNNETGFLADVEYEIKLNKEWVYPSMGFDEKKLIEFPLPKTFAYRANIEQLAEYTLKLIEDDALRERMGKTAAQHALNNFHYKNLAKNMLEAIENKIDKVTFNNL